MTNIERMIKKNKHSYAIYIANSTLRVHNHNHTSNQIQMCSNKRLDDSRRTYKQNRFEINRKIVLKLN